jgi:hypothetical protein
MTRRLLNLPMVMSLLPFAVTAGLWARSYGGRQELWVANHLVTSMNGRLYVESAPEWLQRIVLQGGWFSGFENGPPAPEAPPLVTPVHYAVPMLVLVVPAGASAVRAWRRTRPSKCGRCAGCGYDLRATPDRCPECGTPAPAARPCGKIMAADLGVFAGRCRGLPLPVSRYVPRISVVPTLTSAMDRGASTTSLSYATPVPHRRWRDWRWNAFSLLAAGSFGLFIDAYWKLDRCAGIRDGDYQDYGYALFRGPTGLSDPLVFVPYALVAIGTALVCLTWVVAWRVRAHRGAAGNVTGVRPEGGTRGSDRE